MYAIAKAAARNITIGSEVTIGKGKVRYTVKQFLAPAQNGWEAVRVVSHNTGKPTDVDVDRLVPVVETVTATEVETEIEAIPAAPRVVNGTTVDADGVPLAQLAGSKLRKRPHRKTATPPPSVDAPAEQEAPEVPGNRAARRKALRKATRAERLAAKLRPIGHRADVLTPA